MAKKNIGKSRNTTFPKYIKRFITTPDNFRLEVADMATPAAFKAAIQALLKNPINSRGYLWPTLFKTDKMSTETQYESTPITQQDVNDGQYGWKFHVAKDLFTHQAMQSHKSINEGRILVQDVDNVVWFMLDEDGKGAGFSIGILKAEKMSESDGSNVSTSPILCILDDNEEFDVNGTYLDKTFGAVLKTVEPLTDVLIELTDGDAFDAAGFKVDVSQKSDGTPVSGLQLADFVMLAADGITAQVIESALPDANVAGRYEILSPGANPFEDGSLTLRAASLITAAVGAYECNDPLAVAIP